jgi:hypothetical protein
LRLQTIRHTRLPALINALVHQRAALDMTRSGLHSCITRLNATRTPSLWFCLNMGCLPACALAYPRQHGIWFSSRSSGIEQKTAPGASDVWFAAAARRGMEPQPRANNVARGMPLDDALGSAELRSSRHSYAGVTLIARRMRACFADQRGGASARRLALADPASK